MSRDFLSFDVLAKEKPPLCSRGWKVKERVGLLTGKLMQQLTASGAGMGATATVIKAVTPQNIFIDTDQNC